MRVAWPRNTGRTPAANGSSVPPCPTRRRRTGGGRGRRRHGTWARGLVHDEDAVGHRARLRSVTNDGCVVGDEPLGLGQDGGRACAMGSSTVAPAARAWPPPPNVAGQRGRIDAARRASGR